MMWLGVVFAGLFCTLTHAFVAAPIRWGAHADRSFGVAPQGFWKTHAVPISSLPLELTIVDQPDKIALQELPHFVAKPDKTIVWDSTGFCVEASGDQSGDVVRVNRCTGIPAQLWNFLPWGNGRSNQIQLRHTTKCIDIDHDVGALNGASLELRECDRRGAKPWAFEGPVLLPTQGSAQHLAVAQVVRSLTASFILFIVVAALSVSTWLWWLPRERRRVLLSHNGATPCVPPLPNTRSSVDQGGVCLTEPFDIEASGAHSSPMFDTNVHDMVAAVMAIYPKPVNRSDDEQRRRCSVIRMNQNQDVGDKLAAMPQFSLDTLIFDRYVGELTYAAVDAFEDKGAENFGSDEDGNLGKARFAFSGAVQQRIFVGTRDDPTQVATGAYGTDRRAIIREYSSGSSDEAAAELNSLVARELDVMTALWDTAEGPVKPFERPNKPFTRLLGSLTRAMQDMEPLPAEQAEAWVGNLSTPPPRSQAKWLVYEYDGLYTVERFSVPNQLRMSRLKPRRRQGAPLPITWGATASFIVKGIIQQTLEALAIIHDAGYAHRSLSPECIVLGCTEEMNNDGAWRTCNTSALVVKLQQFAFASPLGDNSKARQETAKSWNVSPDSTVDLTSLSIAEDLHAAGYVFLTVLLGALAEPDKDGEDANPEGPLRSYTSLEQQIEYGEGDIQNGFRDYVSSEPAWERVSAFLDKKGGWDFLERLLRARQAASETKNAFSFRTASSMLAHPFLK